MILLSGYSTMPSAPFAFRHGTISRTTFSSTIVSIATLAVSESCETVGLGRAGSSPIIFYRCALGRFILRPTFEPASSAARRSIAMVSIFLRFSGFSHEALLAINLVLV